MRILLFTDHHAPSGGAEKYFFELKEKLKMQPDLQVFSLGFGKHPEQGDDYQVIRGTRSRLSKLFWQIFNHWGSYRALRDAVIHFNPDVIHIHHIKEHSAATLKAITGYPVIQTVHDYGVICPVAHNIHKNLQPCSTGFKLSCFWQHQIKFNLVVYMGMILSFALMRKRLRRTVHHFLTVSPLLATYMQQHALQPVAYIPPFKRNVEEHFDYSANHRHFLYAGHLGTHKGTHLLLKEFALAIAQNPKLHLTIAGGGAEENILRNLVIKLDLTNHVTFTGWMSNIDELYQSHFAVIVPSIWMEAFGLIITEAMSHTRPVIGSNRGSIPWLIDNNQTGLIFDPLQPGDLAEKMLLLAGNPELAQKLGKNARQKLRHMINNDASLNEIISIYKSVAANKKGA